MPKSEHQGSSHRLHAHTLLCLKRSAFLAFFCIRRRDPRRLGLVEGIFFALEGGGVVVIAVFFDRCRDLLGNIIVAVVTSVGVGGVEVGAVELFFALLFVGFALFDLAVETNLLASLVAVPEDEHEN